MCNSLLGHVGVQVPRDLNPCFLWRAWRAGETCVAGPLSRPGPVRLSNQWLSAPGGGHLVEVLPDHFRVGSFHELDAGEVGVALVHAQSWGQHHAPRRRVDR